MRRRWLLPVLLGLGLLLSFLIPQYGLLNRYVQMIIIYVGINIILTVSLNLINGYMGEFSVGHAGLMAVGAYVSSILTVKVFPDNLGALLFPAAVLAAGLVTALVGILVAFPSFKTRGDYLAIVTLAFTMIVKSTFENIDAVGGSRGFMGMEKLTSLPTTFIWTVLSVWAIRNFIYSKYGRGVLSIREDEIACELMSVSTRKVKFLTFALAAFFAGVAGALYAHVLLFINPRGFDLVKSTEILIMVYLGGTGSLIGSILGAGIYTTLLEVLRPLGVWRMVLMPLVLVLLMLFRPRGIMGGRELPWFVPQRDLKPPRATQSGKEVAHAPAES